VDSADGDAAAAVAVVSRSADARHQTPKPARGTVPSVRSVGQPMSAVDNSLR